MASSFLYFVFGNQEFDLKQTQNKIIAQLAKEKEINEYHFSAHDFTSKDSTQNTENIEKLQNLHSIFDIFGGQNIICIHHCERFVFSKNKKTSQKIASKTIYAYQTEESKKEYSEVKPPTPEFEQVQTDLLMQQNKDKTSLIKLKNGQKQSLSQYLNPEVSFNNPHNEVSYILKFIKETVEFAENNIVICIANIRKLTELDVQLKHVIEKHATIYKTTITYDNFSPLTWIEKKSKEMSLCLSHQQFKLIIELVGSDLLRLENELNKIQIYTQSSSNITDEIIINLLSATKHYSIFNLLNYISIKNVKQTEECLSYLVNTERQDIIYLFSVIVGQVRRLLKIQCWLDMGYKQFQIAKKMNVHEFIVSEQLKQLSRFKQNELENILIHLSQLDLEIKYMHHQSYAILSNFCFKIILGVYRRN